MERGVHKDSPGGQLGGLSTDTGAWETLTFLANKEKIEMKKRTKQLAVL